MLGTQLVSETRLATFLNVDLPTLRQKFSHLAMSSPLAHTPQYLVASVDALLRVEGCARNFPGAVPSAAKMLAQKEDLLTVREVAARLGKQLQDVYRLISRGGIPSFYLFGSIIRLPPKEVAAAYAQMHNDEAVGSSVASRLLCTHRDRFNTHVRRGSTPFKLMRVPLNTELHVSRTTLLETLAQQLPDYITPLEWWELVIQHGGEMITVNDLAARCHGQKKSIMERIEREQVPYIKTLGGHWRIPLHAVQPWIDDVTPMTAADLADIFGTWRIISVSVQHICRRNHGPAQRRCPQRQCVRTYIEQHRSTPDIDPEAWIRAALDEDLPPIALGDLLAEYKRLDVNTVRTRLARGDLPYVPLPGSDTKEPIIAANHLHLVKG